MSEVNLGPVLRCCQGAPAPAQVVEGWKSFLVLPESAREDLWAVLEPALLAPGDRDALARVESFSKSHGTTTEKVGGAIIGAGYLIERSAALDLGIEDVRHDCLALSGQNPPGASELLLARYDEIRARIRQGILEQTLADHGKVLVGVDWRVDTVSASDRGANLSAAVVLLTLRYREGDRSDRVTLQLTPEALAHLRAFTNRFGS